MQKQTAYGNDRLFEKLSRLFFQLPLVDLRFSYPN